MPPTEKELIQCAQGRNHTDCIYKQGNNLIVVVDKGKEEKETVISGLDFLKAWNIIDTAVRNRIKPKKKAPAKHSYGQNGKVKLTDAEFERLNKDYPPAKVQAAIDYVDESAASTENRNGWKNWNLVVRRALRENWAKTVEEAPKQCSYDMDEFKQRADILPVYRPKKMEQCH